MLCSISLGYLTYHQQCKFGDLLFTFDNTTYELLKIQSRKHIGEVFICHSTNTISDNMGNKMETLYGNKGFMTETRIYKGSMLQQSLRYETDTSIASFSY